MSEGSYVFLVTLSLVGAGLLGWKLFGPLVNALARRLEHRATGESGVVDQVADLQERVRDLEAQQARMQELEERLDFTERLVVRARAELKRVDTPPEPVDAL